MGGDILRIDIQKIKNDIWNELNESGQNDLLRYIKNNEIDSIIELNNRVISQRNMFMSMYGESYYKPIK